MTHTSKETDGKFDLFYRGGWAYLVVHPPLPHGRPVYPEDVENRMRLLGVPPVRTKVIRRIIDAAQGTPESLVEWPAGRALEATINVRISEDAMSASVVVQPPKRGAAPPEVSDVIEALNHSGVLHGIDRDRVQRLLSKREYDVERIVATGRAPVSGAGRRVTYHFNVNRGKPYLEMDFGRINLKELNFIENCHQGELLAELEPPVGPVAGETVTGQSIPAEAEVSSAQLRAGANTRLADGGRALYAASDGNVRLANGVILVEPVVTVRNVSYETGNIYFEGSVVIEESVADGFVVEADGDIQVGKGVGKATLRAGGNILLKTGISGNGEGNIDCGGDLFAKYIESSTVTCRGNVIVEEAIMQSRVTAFGHIVLNGRRSEIIASDLIVGGALWCKKLGNVNEAPTHVAAGVEPNLLITFRATVTNILEKQEEWNKVDQQLEQIERAIADGRTEARVLTAKRQLQVNLEQLEAEISRLQARIPALKDRMEVSGQSMVVAEAMIFKGVVITFGTLEYHAPDAGARKTILRVKDGQVVESGFNYYNRPKLTFNQPRSAVHDPE